jgi:hypothetical protein
MPETVHTNIPEHAAGHPEAQVVRAQPVLSRAALEGVGVAAEHFYGADDHLFGKTWDGEHRLIVERTGKDGKSAREAVGVGTDIELALHDSLKQMRSLETVRTRSLAHIEMTDNASVDFTAFEHYSPKIAPGTESHPVPSYLDSMLTDTRLGNMTYLQTTAEKGWQAKTRTVLQGYLAGDPAGQQLVESLKIRSLDHLTPEQAVKLSAAFVQNVSKYSDADLKVPSATRADHSTAAELLQEGIDHKGDKAWQGNGVCRNIASNVKAVFESLKATQGELSMLNNTYAVYGAGLEGAGYNDSRKNEHSTKLGAPQIGHAWNTFVTVDADGSAAATIIDATWALGEDADAALDHLDRTEVRAAKHIVDLYGKSQKKPEAFEGLSDYANQLVRIIAINPKVERSARAGIREYVTSEYLKAAAELPEIPEDYMLPSSLVGAAYQLRGQLDKTEVQTLFKLDKAGGSCEAERLKAVIAGYDKDRKVPLPDWKNAENLVFADDELQALAIDAIGEDRAAHLAEESGKFRACLREQRPESLPTFDPRANIADAAELRYIASQSGVHEKNPDSILSTMRRRLKTLAGGAGVLEAVTVGRSEYDLVRNYAAITEALKRG